MSGTHLPSKTTTVYLANYATGNPFVVDAKTSISTTVGDAIYGSPAQAWTLKNAGTVSSASHSADDIGVALEGGGRVSNEASGVIESSRGDALDIANGQGSVANAGTIAGRGAGVDLMDGGAVSNAKGGLIMAANNKFGPLDRSLPGPLGDRDVLTNAGVGADHRYFSGSFDGGGADKPTSGSSAQFNGGVALVIGGAAGEVTNEGVISGGMGGVSFADGGSVSNTSVGVIIAGLDGVGIQIAGAPGSVNNQGDIYGGLAGVNSHDGGSIANSGRISGDLFAIDFYGHDGEVSNCGVISAAYAGVGLSNGGNVSNESGGVIASGFGGSAVDIAGARGTVTNAATIDGGSVGVRLDSGGSVGNAAAATIYGGRDGVDALYGSVGNAGTIIGGTRAAAYFAAGGSVVNQQGATMAGGQYGVDIEGAAGTLSNDGTITSTSLLAADLAMGGTIANQSGGMIKGDVLIQGAAGVVINAGEIKATDAGQIALVLTATENTLTNSGTIIGYSHGSAAEFGAGNDLLIIDPRGVFVGDVDGGNGTNTLQLAAGTAAGSFSGLGAQFTDFQTVIVEAGATWTITGTNTIISSGMLTDAAILTIAGTLYNAGVIAATGLGIVTVEGAVDGAGTAEIEGGSLDAAGIFDEDVAFTGRGGVLKLSHGYAGVVSGFSTGSAFDLTNIDFMTAQASYSGAGSKGVLTVTDGTHVDSIAMSGDYVISEFELGKDARGGTTVVAVALCPAFEPTETPTLPIHAFLAACASLGASMGAAVSPTSHSWRERPSTLCAPRIQLT